MSENSDPDDDGEQKGEGGFQQQQRFNNPQSTVNRGKAENTLTLTVINDIEIELDREIGEGAYGKVYKAIWFRPREQASDSSSSVVSSQTARSGSEVKNKRRRSSNNSKTADGKSAATLTPEEEDEVDEYKVAYKQTTRKKDIEEWT